MGISPTQRTLKYFKSKGYDTGIVERFIKSGTFGHRIDLFHIIDLIVLDPNFGIIGVQSCGQAFSEHERKLLIEEKKNTIKWLTTPHTKLILMGWRKVKLKRRGKAMRWKPRIAQIYCNQTNKELTFYEYKKEELEVLL